MLSVVFTLEYLHVTIICQYSHLNLNDHDENTRNILFFFGGGGSNADYLNIMYLSIHSFGLIKSSLIIHHSLFNR